MVRLIGTTNANAQAAASPAFLLAPELFRQAGKGGSIVRSRILFSLVIIASLALGGFSSPAPARALSCGPCPATTTDALNLRDGPSLDAAVLLVMPVGAELQYDTSIPAEKGYLAVSYGGVDGYAHRLYLLLFPASATTTDWLNLRSGPTLDSPIVQVMAPGSEMQVRGRSENGYFAVAFEQRVPGFAHGDFLDFDGTGGFADGDLVVVRTDALNMRAAAGLNTGIESVLFTGHELTITGGPVERDGYEWYRVDAGSAGNGWVAGEYLAYA